MVTEIKKRVSKKSAKQSPEPEEQKSAESAATDMFVTSGSIERHPSLVYRERHDEDKINSLKDSISSNGLLNPISVFVDNGKIYLVAGDRRLTAIKQMDSVAYTKFFPKGIPARNVATEISSAKLLQAAENLSREDITSYEVAMTIKSLAEDGHKTSQIAEAIGKSQTYVRDYIRFNKEASEDLVESLRDGDVSFDDALRIMKLTEEEQQEKVTKLREVAERTESEKKKAQAKKEVVTEVKQSRGEAERATKKQIVEVRDELLSDAFAEEDLSPKYSKGALYFAAAKACDFVLGVITASEFVDIMEKAGAAYAEAVRDYVNKS